MTDQLRARVYLGTEGVEFTFQPDQPQAGVFLRLLDPGPDHAEFVVQESRTREIDDLEYKYVGVGGGRQAADRRGRLPDRLACSPTSPARTPCWPPSSRPCSWPPAGSATSPSAGW